MLSRLIEWSLSQRLLALAATIALAAAGVNAYLSLPIDAFPDISPTQVKLILKAPGMTPEEVENRVIVPIELGLLGIPRQVMLRSSAKYAIADITIDFAEGTDIYWARQQVAERYADVQGDLPDGIEGGLAPLATPLSDLFMFTIEGGDLSPQARRTLLDFTLRPALRTIPGVADVNSLGGEVRTLTVVPDREALTRTGLGFTDLVAAIESNNRNDGAGRLVDGEEALIVRAEGAIRTPADLRAIVVAERNGSPVRLGDVADVRTESLTRYGAVTRDGQGEAGEGLGVGVRGGNAAGGGGGGRGRVGPGPPQAGGGDRIEIRLARAARQFQHARGGLRPAAAIGLARAQDGAVGRDAAPGLHLAGLVAGIGAGGLARYRSPGARHIGVGRGLAARGQRQDDGERAGGGIRPAPGPAEDRSGGGHGLSNPRRRRWAPAPRDR